MKKHTYQSESWLLKPIVHNAAQCIWACTLPCQSRNWTVLLLHTGTRRRQGLQAGFSMREQNLKKTGMLFTPCTLYTEKVKACFKEAEKIILLIKNKLTFCYFCEICWLFIVIFFLCGRLFDKPGLFGESFWISSRVWDWQWLWKEPERDCG